MKYILVFMTLFIFPLILWSQDFPKKINAFEAKKLKKLLGVINEKQSFFLSFKNVYFVSVDRDPNQYCFCLVKRNKILFRFIKPEESWSLFEIKAISFIDMNFDGYQDVTIIMDQMTGVGPTAAQTFNVSWVYLNNRQKGFFLYPTREL